MAKKLRRKHMHTARFKEAHDRATSKGLNQIDAFVYAYNFGRRRTDRIDSRHVKDVISCLNVDGVEEKLKIAISRLNL